MFYPGKRGPPIKPSYLLETNHFWPTTTQCRWREVLSRVSRIKWLHRVLARFWNNNSLVEAPHRFSRILWNRNFRFFCHSWLDKPWKDKFVLILDFYLSYDVFLLILVLKHNCRIFKFLWYIFITYCCTLKISSFIIEHLV